MFTRRIYCNDVDSIRYGYAALSSITEGNRFKFDPDGVHDRNHWPRFEFKGRQH